MTGGGTRACGKRQWRTLRTRLGILLLAGALLPVVAFERHHHHGAGHGHVHAGPGMGHPHAEPAPDHEHWPSGLLSWLPHRGGEPAEAGRARVGVPSARLGRLDPGYATVDPNAEYATVDPNAEYATVRVDEHDHSYDPFPRNSCSTMEVGPARFAPGLLREAKAPGVDSECIRTARARAPPATDRPIRILLLSS